MSVKMDKCTSGNVQYRKLLRFGHSVVEFYLLAPLPSYRFLISVENRLDSLTFQQYLHKIRDSSAMKILHIHHNRAFL